MGYEEACEKTDALRDEAPKVIYGGNGNLGTNRLGLPYASNAIGTGPQDITTPDDNRGVRKDASFTRNFGRERITDHTQDRQADRIYNRR